MDEDVYVSLDKEMTAEEVSKCFICAPQWLSSEFHDHTEEISLKYSDVGNYRFELVHDSRSELHTKLNPYLAFLYPATSNSGYPSIDVKRNPWDTEPISVRVVPKLKSNTGDESCFQQLLEWLRVCENDHLICQRQLRSGDDQIMPTRLIDLNSHPKLVETVHHHDFIKKRTKYVTLSHRWTPEFTAKLLKSNIEYWKRKLDYAALPQVFSDAMSMAKRLGVFYIWIDALCIIQDDQEDWRRESSIMGAVYQNAHCNFGAIAAAEAVEDRTGSRRLGLFTSREIEAITHVDISRHNHQGTYCVVPREISYAGHLPSTPLLRRGWVFQERLLSPRSMFFGNVLSWECPELLATENFPEGISGWPFRLASRTKLFKNKSTILDNDVPFHALYSSWLGLVQDYRLSELSYASDLLPAMSGVAHRFSEALGDEYLAGLWKSDMVRGLLWQSGRVLLEETVDEPPHAYRGKR